MRSFLMSMCIVVCGASFTFAEDFVAEEPPTPPEPPAETPVETPEETPVDVSSGSQSNAAGALVLLALIGMVVASGTGGFATRRGDNAMVIDADEAEDNAGF